MNAWRNYNPLKLLPWKHNFSYERLPSESRNASTYTLQPFRRYRFSANNRLTERFPFLRLSLPRLLSVIASFVLSLVLLIIILTRPGPPPPPLPEFLAFHWQHFRKLDGYYNGIRTLVPFSEWTSQNGFNVTAPLETVAPAQATQLPKKPPIDPVVYSPYPDYNSPEYVENYGSVQKCYLDAAKTIEPPDIFAYPGVPQNMSAPMYGSYEELGLEGQVCFDRFSRFASYGYGFNKSQGGLGPGQKVERQGADKIFAQVPVTNFSRVDWGTQQKTCYEANKARFREADQPQEEKKIQRHAYVLRIWGGYYFNEHQMYSLRAMVNELALKSGGEYDVHFLLHVKNESIPIWASPKVYQQVIENNMPREFWNMTTLWSESLMERYYPGPFGEAFANVAHSPVHGVYRSAHMALQWFAQQHPEYDFFWNWEMDLRYSGHYYEFNTRLGEWAKQQPRKGLWERGAKFYFPNVHNTWDNFTQITEREIKESDIAPIWGPQNFSNTGMLKPPSYAIPPRSYDEDKYEWGVGEDADLITFNPLFDPTTTNWVFKDDLSGYNLDMNVPPRRAAIITVARLSKRLLDIMHEETWNMKHSAFPEMWPPTVAFHHGLKAVFAPHPVYFDHDWNLENMVRVYNYPREIWESPYGWGEHNLLGSSFYYNSHFSGALWRRWLGVREQEHGGRKEEEEGTGRMCLRSTLHHPIKGEVGPMD